MKIIKYLTAALIAMIAWSCADEGPETMGSFEIKCIVDNINSRSAKITITIPKSDDQVITEITESWLVASEEGENIYAGAIQNETETATVQEIFFTGLKPSTTYKIISKAGVEINGKSFNDGAGCNYWDIEIGILTTPSDNEAFTTDYLLISDNCVAFNLSLDQTLTELKKHGIERIYISENPNMTNAVGLNILNQKVEYNQALDAASVCLPDNGAPTATVTIKGLKPDTKYYYFVEMMFPDYYNANNITVTPGNNSFTTTRQPAEILKSTKISPKLKLQNSEYNPNQYSFSCDFDFGSLNIKEGHLYLSGGANEDIVFYGNKGISKNLYISDTTPLSYSLGMIVDFVKDGVTYTANGITYTPEDNVIQIPEAK